MPTRMPKTGNEKKTAKRLIKDLWSGYKKELILVVIFLLLTSISNTVGSIFTPKIVDEVITPVVKYHTKEFADVKDLLLNLIITMGSLYAVGIVSSLVYNRIMAGVTQSFLNDMRKKTFGQMEKLPISYFDRNTHGDIMSIYTNDIDAVRQFVGSSIPNLIHCVMILSLLVIIMFTYSIWLSLIVFVGVICMFFTTKYVGGNSAKYFVNQQRTVGKLEGYIEEMMHGQKVVKVFCHEEETKNRFDEINEELRMHVTKANSFGNILGPIMGNIGNIMYICLAVVGTLLYYFETPNLTLTGLSTTSIGVIVAFLPMSRQFTQNVNQASMQINSIVMAMAGAERVYKLIDQEPETDEGYVTLVNATYDNEGNLCECSERTGIWAWKHPHKADGSVTYTLLQGDIRMFDVDFGYYPEKIVLHDVTLYAYPGQKVAFVGATGAGKTTITNLINRFYDIADGKIRYDGININKIKKDDLRRSLGIVLQDTNLFTGTVRENIRYGKLDATDEEIIKAAKIANAYDFITRLPHGFDTMLESDGANLSQGQRQLISIARAAVADAPVMILDEATSSIDTRTERLVQQGTDQLMHGRTVFVIAHRLSTVQNSDVIMVLEHGRIIERGSHDDLIAKGGQYYQLYTGAFELE